jgi:hypothetical protein
MLLFDLGKTGTQGINYLLNNPLNGVTLLAVEDQARPLRSELSDLFPLVFMDEDSTQSDLVTHPPSSVNFDKERFQGCVAANFALSVESRE